MNRYKGSHWRVLPFVALALFGELPLNSGQAGAAQVNASGGDVFLSGDIDRDTVAKTMAYGEQIRTLTIRLDSGGGDVIAAMELGRYLRKREARAFVVPDGACASACLFLLAGATTRMFPSRQIGVHRPYTGSTNLSTADAATAYRQTSGLVKEYLEEMNIPSSLLDLMNSISPNDVKWLTHDQVALYFPTFDPVYEDKQQSKQAAKRGISKAEYIMRVQRIDQECPPPFSDEGPEYDPYFKCVDDVLDGIR